MKNLKKFALVSLASLALSGALVVNAAELVGGKYYQDGQTPAAEYVDGRGNTIPAVPGVYEVAGTEIIIGRITKEIPMPATIVEEDNTLPAGETKDIAGEVGSGVYTVKHIVGDEGSYTVDESDLEFTIKDAVAPKRIVGTGPVEETTATEEETTTPEETTATEDETTTPEETTATEDETTTPEETTATEDETTTEEKRPDGSLPGTIYDELEDNDINPNPDKNNQVDTPDGVIEDANNESFLDDVYPTKEQALAEVAKRSKLDPHTRFSVIETKNGQFYIYAEPKLEEIRYNEKKVAQGYKFAKEADAAAYGEHLQGLYNNLGFEVVVNGDGSFSIKLFEKEYVPGKITGLETFNSVRDAEAVAAANVGENEYYVIVKTPDNKYVIKYHEKTGIRPYELDQIKGQKFGSEGAAKKYAADIARRYKDFKYEIDTDDKGNYIIKVLAATPEAKGDDNKKVDVTEKDNKDGSKPDADGSKPGADGSKPGADGSKPKSGGSSEAKKSSLPETGESSSYAIFGAAALAVLAGVGLVAPSFKKEN